MQQKNLNMLDYLYSKNFVEYPDAILKMEELVQDIREHKKNSSIWFLEHPHIYTAGSSAQKHDLIHEKFPIYQSGRGGKYTYHGPGQRVVYLMINLLPMGATPDIRNFIIDIEHTAMHTLKDIGINTFLKKDMVGIWTRHRGKDLKIASIGIRVKRWVTYHGIAFNIYPDLSAFDGIIPCGIREFGVTSLKDLGFNITLEDFDRRFIKHFCKTFNFNIDKVYEI